MVSQVLSHPGHSGSVLEETSENTGCTFRLYLHPVIQLLFSQIAPVGHTESPLKVTGILLKRNKLQLIFDTRIV